MAIAMQISLVISQRESLYQAMYTFSQEGLYQALLRDNKPLHSLQLKQSIMLWLRQIIGQMIYSGSDINSVKLYRDNQGLLSLAENLEFH
jgi:hypothetical protein